MTVVEKIAEEAWARLVAAHPELKTIELLESAKAKAIAKAKENGIGKQLSKFLDNAMEVAQDQLTEITASMQDVADDPGDPENWDGLFSDIATLEGTYANTSHTCLSKKFRPVASQCLRFSYELQKAIRDTVLKKAAQSGLREGK